MKCHRCFKGWITTTVSHSWGTLLGVPAICPDCLGNFHDVMSYSYRRIVFNPETKSIIVYNDDAPCLPDPTPFTD